MVRPANTSKESRRKKNPPQPEKPSPVSSISRIGSLKRYPDKDYANSLLHQVAKLVAPIIHENNFKVGNLCEMFPKNPNLLGLNVNRGQKILIRLRYHSNDRLFYPLGDIIGTFLHELTHNLYGAHDEKFYKFLDGLKTRFEEIQSGQTTTSGYRCEEEKLGSGYNPSGGYVSVKEKRIKELSKLKYKAEVRKLGGDGRISKTTDPRKLREAMLQAAERRLKDNKWCHSNSEVTEAEPSREELDIEEVE
ncbi:WLM-domain-containing protein, partial [Suhomyces tanzawaensis NRRL Y-17324]